jgi:hypothetical protein
VRLPEHVVRSSVCPAEIRADQNTAGEPQLSALSLVTSGGLRARA